MISIISYQIGYNIQEQLIQAGNTGCQHKTTMFLWCCLSLKPSIQSTFNICPSSKHQCISSKTMLEHPGNNLHHAIIQLYSDHPSTSKTTPCHYDHYWPLQCESTISCPCVDHVTVNWPLPTCGFHFCFSETLTILLK